jgi:glycosyltransferase involved in cell wall biosynthesis
MALKKRLGGLGIKRVLRSVYSRTASAPKPVYDLYWEPNYIPLDGIRSRKTVVTVYDMSVQDHPEWHPDDRVRFHEQNFFPNIGKADLVTTISEFSRQRFLALQNDIPAERVRVIPCGVDRSQFRVFEPEVVEAFRKKQQLPQEFILFVGTFEPRKNLLHLLEAYGQLPASLQNRFPLVLAGDSGWQNKEIQKRIAGMGNAVRKMEYMKSRSDLALLYNAASVFVFPSLYEGFGMPPLEAMACGTPVCLSSIPVFHEIYGDENVCYGDPLDARSFSHSLCELLEDSQYQKRLIENGMETARFYTWDRAVEGYLAAFRELMD